MTGPERVYGERQNLRGIPESISVQVHHVEEAGLEQVREPAVPSELQERLVTRGRVSSKI